MPYYTLAGVNPDFLDYDPGFLILLEEAKPEVEMIAISEHPTYAKYYKMMKFGTFFL